MTSPAAVPPESSNLHVVLGAGPVGVTLASQLAEAGCQVRLVSRRGIGPALGGVSFVRADASDAPALRHATAGAAVIYNGLNPPYHRWPVEWPTWHRHVLDAATAHGATLAMVDNDALAATVRWSRHGGAAAAAGAAPTAA